MGRTHKDNSYDKNERKIKTFAKGKKKPIRNLNMSVEDFFDHEYDAYRREFED